MGGRRPRLTPGSLAAILAAAAALVCSLAFLFFISGSGLGRLRPAPVEEVHAIPTEPDAPITPRPTEALTPSPTASPQPEVMPEDGQIVRFTLAATGSVSCPRAIRESAMEAGHYDFSTVFLGLGRSLTDADVSVATLETLTDGLMGYDATNAPPELLDALRDAGVDLLSLASEQMMAKGREGLDVTCREMTSRGMDALGLTEGALPGVILTVAGAKVAFLAYTYGLEAETADGVGLIARLDEAQMVADIATARTLGADIVVLLPHWGVKNRADTPESVRALAGRLAAAGADIILGAHSGVVQGVERLAAVRTDGREAETLVCYSLGNLLTDARAEENAAGLVLRIPILYDAATRSVSLEEAQVIPIYIACQEEDGLTVWRIVEAENEAALSGLVEAERAAALRAVQRVRRATEGEL